MDLPKFTQPVGSRALVHLGTWRFFHATIPCCLPSAFFYVLVLSPPKMAQLYVKMAQLHVTLELVIWTNSKTGVPVFARVLYKALQLVA